MRNFSRRTNAQDEENERLVERAEQLEMQRQVRVYLRQGRANAIRFNQSQNRSFKRKR